MIIKKIQFYLIILFILVSSRVNAQTPGQGCGAMGTTTNIFTGQQTSYWYNGFYDCSGSGQCIDDGMFNWFQPGPYENYLGDGTCHDGDYENGGGWWDLSCSQLNYDGGDCAPGCTNPNAFNYDPNADVDDGSCVDFVYGCTNSSACNYKSNANTNNNSCVFASGCNYCAGNSTNGTGYVQDGDSDNDGVCNWNEISGCQNSSACNYNVNATDASNCLFATGCDYCAGNSFNGSGYVQDNDQDNDGVCNELEIVGCQDPTACNYMSIATDPGSCIYSTDLDACATCSGEQDGSGVIVDNDQDNDGVCDADEIEGCTDTQACNYDSTPTTDTNNGLCIYSTDLDACATCSGEQDGSGVIVDNDQDNDGVCDADEIEGCTDTQACNYDSTPTTDTNNGLCIYSTDLDACATCSGEQDGSGLIVDNDQDNDGVCDADEIIGCQDEVACNYMSIATDPGSCIYSTDLDACATCSGEQDGSGVIVDNDQDNDGVCDADEIEGCTDTQACNYDSTPTTDTNNGLCIYSTDLDACATCSGEQDGSGVIVDNDQDNDGVCDADEIEGCTDTQACNYDSTPTTDTNNGLCVYSTDLDACATCSGEQDGSGLIVDNDQDNDGVCDADEIIGCQDEVACNYMSIATDPGSCIYSTDLDACATCSGEQDGSGVIVDNDQDNDGVCDADEIEGCTDTQACNYDSTPTTDTNNGLCIYSTDLDACATCSGEQDGSGVIVDNDQDNDGVCDADEIEGCTDTQACNYDSTPTTDTNNGLCVYSTDLDACATCSGEQDGSGLIVDNDQDNDGVCDADEIEGCTDTQACNYDSTPTTDTNNGLCVYSTDLDACATCSGEQDGSGVIVDNDQDNDGVCDADEIEGCTDTQACNYDSTPTTDTNNGLCIYSTDLDACATCSGEQMEVG